MKARGFVRTALQCRIKVKKLRQKYFTTRDKMRKSGESSDIKDTCPFYDELDSILCGSACANPKNVIEGGSVDQQSDEESSVAELSNNDPEDGEGTASTSNTSESDPPGEVRSKPPAKANTSCKASTDKKSSVKELTTLISSVMEQQRRDHELFILKEDERHCREMELERERYRLQMEMEERRRQAQVESDQAMMRMITQVMTTVVPALHIPPYPNETVSRRYLPEEPSFHSLTPRQQPNTMASGYGQGASVPSTDEQPLSSLLHELNKFN